MGWLALQVGWLLLLAAGFGGLIGWALRAMRSGQGDATKPLVRDTRETSASWVLELEAQLREARDTIADLRRKAEMDAAAAGVVTAEESERLTLRNRQLEARVRYLESKLDEMKTAEPLQQEAEPELANRLLWQNRYLHGRLRYIEEELRRALTSPEATAIRLAGEPVRTRQADMVEPAKPALLLSAPRGQRADNLKMISGVGPRLERKLNDLGVWHFDQIAGWTPAEVAWVNAAVAARGRIEKDGWIAQAARLAQPQREEA